MNKKSFLKTALVTAVAIAAIPGAMMYTDYAISNQPEPEQWEEAVSIPRVTVIPVQAGRHQAKIQAYGEVTAVDEIGLSSNVSGRVIWRSPQFVKGAVVNAGDVLLRIDPVEYQAAVALAEQDVADAELALLQEKRQSAQAEKDWRRAGLKEQASALVLRKPQLQAAKARYRAAAASLKKARHDLALTELKAPFSAVVVSRNVAVGSYVDAGVELSQLRSSEQAEVVLSLSAQEWQLLPENPKGMAVALNRRAQLSLDALPSKTASFDASQEMTSTWQGQISRASRLLDNQTRLRELIVSVDQPLQQKTPLLTGSFVDVSIQGRELDNLFAIPVSALTADSYIWFLTEDGLKRQKVTPLFTGKSVTGKGVISKKTTSQHTKTSTSQFYIAQGNLPEQLQLVRKPLASYLPGMKVEGVNAEGVKVDSAAVTDVEGDRYDG